MHVIQGKRVDTKSAHRRDQALARKVFVGGLDTEVADEELRDYFSQFGKVCSMMIPCSMKDFNICLLFLSSVDRSN